MGWRETIAKWLMGSGDTPSGAPAADPTPSAPQSWAQVVFGPGLPITPWQEDQREPRTYDYLPQVNATLVPRVGWGLLSFSELREIYHTVPEVQLAVTTLINELLTLTPSVLDSEGDPVDLRDYGLEWLVRSPDRRRPWPTWLASWLQNVLVYDAGALRVVRNALGQPMALRVIDGSTIFVLIDANGEIPTPPAPAYTQVVQGTPHLFLTAEELYYRPRFPAIHAPYGRTPIERCLPWIVLLANIEGYQIAWYREGTVPELMLSAPADWTPDQVARWEEAFNAYLSGQLGERRRVRFLPNGFSAVTTKAVDWNDAQYQTARDNVLLSFGVPPSELGKTPGEGLGGKGYMEAMKSAFWRMGIRPLAEYVEGVFEHLLQELGHADWRFVLQLPSDTPDPAQKRQEVLALFHGGLLTLDQALEALGLEPTGRGDVRILSARGTLYVLSEQGLEPVAVQKRFDSRLTGVEPDADRFYGAPVRQAEAPFPSQGANVTHLAYLPEGDEAVTVVLKPLEGEESELQAAVGGPMYPREEAAWRLDRALGFYLVPTSWVVPGQEASAQIYCRRAGPARPAEGYGPQWVERAAVLDYIMGQLDRHRGNWLTHPDDPSRPILIDNGMSFSMQDAVGSPFVEAMRDRELSRETVEALRQCLRKPLIWRSLAALVGREAAAKAKARAKELSSRGRLG